MSDLAASPLGARCAGGLAVFRRLGPTYQGHKGASRTCPDIVASTFRAAFPAERSKIGWLSRFRPI